jgi:DNA ligase-4
MAKIEQLIIENGGKVTNNLGDPKLTHVVLFKQDISRRVSLIRRTSMYVISLLWNPCFINATSRPKRRRLVLTTFVSGCVQEETLLDEDAFAP